MAGLQHRKARFAIDQMQCRGWEGVWIGGGVARAFFNEDFLKDIDVFFDSHATFKKWRSHMHRLGAVESETPGTLRLGKVWYDYSATTRFANADELIAAADFTCCAVFFTPEWKGTFLPAHLEDLKNRRLVMHTGFSLDKGRYVNSSLERAKKLISLGYTPEPKLKALMEEQDAYQVRSSNVGK